MFVEFWNLITLSIEAISGRESQSDVLSQFSHVGVEDADQIGNSLSVSVSGGSSQLVVVGGFFAFGSSVVVLGLLVSESLLNVQLGVGGAVDSVSQ
jgi:hypothetical protein